MQGYFLPPVSFTPEEASALLLLQTLGATLTDRSVQPLVAAALLKVRAVLRPPDQARLAQLDHGIRLAVPEYREQHTPHLAPMQLAIAGRQVLELLYRDKEGRDTQRRVEPIGLVFYNFTWHLVGWCQLRQAYRQFSGSTGAGPHGDGVAVYQPGTVVAGRLPRQSQSAPPRVIFLATSGLDCHRVVSGARVLCGLTYFPVFLMNFTSVRLITANFERLVHFYEQVSNQQLARATPSFAELRTAGGTLAIGDTSTLAPFGGEQVASAAANRSAIIEFRVADVDADYQRLAEYLGRRAGAGPHHHALG